MERVSIDEAFADVARLRRALRHAADIARTRARPRARRAPACRSPLGDALDHAGRARVHAATLAEIVAELVGKALAD